jgi:predicted cupin superfamily sugar epimerase
LKLETVIKELNLKPHPEGGYFCETYRSAETIGKGGLPERYPGERAFGTSILYLLEGHDKSHFHRLKSDEIWYFHLGAAIVLHVVDPRQGYTSIELGSNPAKGQKLQWVIPKGAWFAAEVKGQTGFALAGCAVFPGFDFADFEMGNRDALLAEYPGLSEVIRKFCK